jgi:hypothetical protein
MSQSNGTGELAKSKRQIKSEAKRSLGLIKDKLRFLQKAHFLTWGICCVYWVTMLYLTTSELSCSEHMTDMIQMLNNKNQTSGLQYHPSITLEHAQNLEDSHVTSLVEYECIKMENNVTGAIWNATIAEDGEGVLYSVYGGNGGNVGTEACSHCVALPYQSVGIKPNALDWYSPLRWWDMAWLTVAGCVQFRLRSIEESGGYGGSFGPLVVDEKDIAVTSLQIMSILVTMFFYVIELSISSLWLGLHSDSDLTIDHVSYYTVLERNKTLTAYNGIWLGCMTPMFIIAFRIKSQVQKYEQNQFLTEL